MSTREFDKISAMIVAKEMNVKGILMNHVLYWFIFEDPAWIWVRGGGGDKKSIILAQGTKLWKIKLRTLILVGGEMLINLIYNEQNKMNLSVSMPSVVLFTQRRIKSK